jgi:uncharacterized membrane protein YhhN
MNFPDKHGRQYPGQHPPLDRKNLQAFTAFYCLVIAANLISFTWWTELRVIAKPMIMASLLGFYIAAMGKSRIFLAGMAFALLGDVLLMFKSAGFFLAGLGCFLCMQVMYTITFLQDHISSIRGIILKGLPVLIPSASVLCLLWEDLGGMKLPVLAYTTAISLMVISAIIRRTQVPWYLPVVVGAVLFLISDTLIAISKFGNSFNGIGQVIMGTYMTAQYLIVRGMVEGDRRPILQPAS